MNTNPIDTIRYFAEEVSTFPGKLRLFLAVATLFSCVCGHAVVAQTNDDSLTVRVKDVAEIEGVRGNQLIGYGVVIGLNRTGDRVQQNLYARQTLQNLLERMFNLSRLKTQCRMGWPP